MTKKTVKKDVSIATLMKKMPKAKKQPNMGDLIKTSVDVAKDIAKPATITSDASNPITAPVLDGTTVVTNEFKVDVHRGRLDSRVSEQWWNRPEDQRFTSMDILGAYLKKRKQLTHDRLTKISDLEFTNDDQGRMAISDGTGQHLPTHFSFGKLCEMLPAPQDLIRTLSTKTATAVLQERLAASQRSEEIRLYTVDQPDQGTSEARAITSATYGRIEDWDMFDLIERLTRGETHWKVPGQIDWSKSTHNPYVDITKDNTTLYASDRDFFVFLADDTRPIEVGKLPNGDPDLYFRGFYAWNGEDTNAGLASFYLRGVCQNRNLWGQEQFRECAVRHTKNGLGNFYKKATPILMKFTAQSSQDFEEQTKRAQQLLIAKTDEERVEWLTSKKFTPSRAKEIVEIVAQEERKPLETLYDAVQGVTALARRQKHQNVRLDLEKKGTELFELAA